MCVRVRAFSCIRVPVSRCVFMCVYGVCVCVCMVCVSLSLYCYGSRASPSRSADQNSDVLSDEESGCKSSKGLCILNFM